MLDVNTWSLFFYSQKKGCIIIYINAKKPCLKYHYDIGNKTLKQVKLIKDGNGIPMTKFTYGYSVIGITMN